MKNATLKIQCKDPVGVTGTFFVDDEGNTLTATFKSAYDLFEHLRSTYGLMNIQAALTKGYTLKA